MKKNTCMIMVSLLLLTACSQTSGQAPTAAENPTATQAESSATSSREEEKQVIDEETAYADIIERIEKARTRTDESSIGDILPVEGMNSAHLAYSLTDIDDDGIRELLIMDRIEDETDPYYAYHAAVYSLFDIQDGRAVTVYVKPSGSDYLNLRENNILCLHSQGAGFYQNNYVTYTGDPKNSFDIIENVTMDASRYVTVDGKEDFSYELGLGLSHCVKNAEQGKSHFDRLPDDLELRTKEEWVAAINDLEGYTLIDEEEEKRIDAKYPLFLPDDYTMFPENAWIKEDEAIAKVQGVWTSVGHSQSESWVIEGKKIKEYMAIWAEDWSAPTDEYNFVYEHEIASIDKDTGKWDGEFVVRLKDSEVFLIYKESDNEIMLEYHWANDGYSMTDSMLKDDSKKAKIFPPAENTSAESTIDISGCDTFTQILDKLSKNGEERGYANITLGKTDVLIISSLTFSDGTAIDAEMFYYKDGVPAFLGHVASNGSAYPLAVKDGVIFSGGNHEGYKHTVKDEKLVPLLQFHEAYYDINGKIQFLYIDENGKETESRDETIYKGFYEDFFAAHTIIFTPISIN